MIIGVDARVLMDKNYSGVSQYAANLLAALLEIDKKNEYRLFYNSWSNLEERFRIWARPNVKIIKTRYPNKIFNYVLQKIFKYPKLDKIIGGCDIFFSPHLNFSELSLGTKKILTVHDLSFLRYPEFFSWRKNFWHHALAVKKLIKSYDLIVAVSENTKQDLVELIGLDPAKIKVIYSGINKANHQVDFVASADWLGTKQIQAGYILYLGNLEPRKNLDSLIHAYDMFRAVNPENLSQLVLAGASGWKTSAIYRAYNKSPFRRDIKFTGYIDDQQKEYLYSEAGIFAYPSYYEGFGFPPLEAMSYNLPVVCSNVSSLPEIVGSAALTIDPYNISSLAKALELVIKDSELRKNMISAGQKRVLEFDWLNSAVRYLNIFQEVTALK